MPVMHAPDCEPETISVDATFETKKAAGKVKRIEGYFAAYGNRDLQGDVMVKGCMKKSIAEGIPTGKVPLLDNHVYDVSHMIGLATEGSEDSKGFYASHDVEATDGAQEVALKVANGSVTKASIGFVPVQESWEQDVKGEVTRTLHEVKLYENSVVLHPANEATNIWAKSTRWRGLPIAAFDAAWDEEAAVARVRAFAQRKGGAGTHWLKYADAFVWRDPKRAEEAGGFMLPIADVVDGALVIVPKGLLAAAAQLLGGELGAVPREVLPLVHKTVAAYLRRACPRKDVGAGGAPSDSVPTRKSETQAGPPSGAPTVETPLQDVELRLRMRKHAVDLESVGG
jgi:HK97 family phage prohead protease